MNKTTKKLLAVGLFSLVLASVGLLAIVAAEDGTEEDRSDEKRETRLDQPVRGYVSDQKIQQAAFRYTAVDYFGGHLKEWEYDKGVMIYRERPGMPGTPVDSTSVQLDRQEKELLADVFNLVVKQKLWNQTDQQIDAEDGGEVDITFSVAGHQGQFKLINTHPPRLEQLLFKCYRITESVRQ